MPERARGAPGGPPDAAFIASLEQSLLTEFSARNTQIERLRRLRYLEEPVAIPEAYRAIAPEVRTPLAREQVKRVVGSLTANEPLITVPPPDASEAARRNAGKREEWTKAALRRMEDEAARDVFGMFVDALVSDGAGVMKLVYVPDRWAAYPRRNELPDEPDEAFNARAALFKRAAPFPLAWRDVDVLTFYPLEGEYGLEACLEITDRPKRLVMQRYGLIEDRTTGRLTPVGGATAAAAGSVPAGHGGSVRVVEYWDAEYFAYVVDGHVVKRGRHGYGQVPYTLAYGDQTPSRDPAKAGVSMLAPMLYLVPLLDRLITMKQNAVHLYAYPTPKLTGFASAENSMGDDGRPRPIEFRPGHIFPLYPGEDLSFLQWTGSPPDLDELIALTRNLIEQAGVPSVLFGLPPSGSASGYLLNQLINAARVSFNQISRHAERALERVVALLWRLVERRIGETVYVYADAGTGGWLGLSPKDIGGYYGCRVKLQALGPADAIAEGTFAAGMVHAKLASRRWAMQEKLGIVNPDVMQDEILLEELMDAPEIRRAVIEHAVQAATAPIAPASSGPPDGAAAAHVDGEAIGG